VHGHPLVRYGLPVDWSFWERLARPQLERCDEMVVLTLDGWQESVGVQAELRHASVLRKPVRYWAGAAIPSKMIHGGHDGHPA
jgi:hypothetical protein